MRNSPFTTAFVPSSMRWPLQLTHMDDSTLVTYMQELTLLRQAASMVSWLIISALYLLTSAPPVGHAHHDPSLRLTGNIHHKCQVLLFTLPNVTSSTW